MGFQSLWERAKSVGVPAVAVLALLISLGGVSYATNLVPMNSVGAPQLKKRAVGERALRASSVGARNLKPGSVGARALRNGSVGADALSLPLGAATTFVEELGEVNGGGCREGEIVKCWPPKINRRLSVAFDNPRRGIALVSGSVSLKLPMSPESEGRTFNLNAEVTLDDQVIPGLWSIDIRPGESQVLSFQTSTAITPGYHEIRVHLFGRAPLLNVDVGSAHLTATVTRDLS